MLPARVFVEGFALSLSLCADLGVVNVALIRNGLTRGARAALYLGMGSCAGDMIYAAGSVSLLRLLTANRGVRLALWLGGSAVLLGLMVRMLRETLTPRELPLSGPAPTALSPAREFGRGALLALSSPSSILWFAAVGGSVIAAHAASRAALLTFLGGFFAASTLWSVLLAALTGCAHRRLSPRFVRALSLASALLFAYFAATVFLQGYAEFVTRLPRDR